MTLKKTKKHIQILILLLGGLWLNNYTISAQYLYDVGFGGGIAGYTGELSNNPFYRSSYAVGGFFRSNLNSRFAVTLGFERGVVKGHTNDRPKGTYPAAQGKCDFGFSTKITNAEVLMEVNFFPYPFQTTVRNSSNMTPFYFIGVGMTTAELIKIVGVEEPEHKISDGKPISIPFGVGLRWSVGEQWGMQLRFKGSKLFRDDIDTNVLNDPFEFGEGGFHRQDWIYTTTFMLTYSFGENIWDCNCP